MCMHGHAHALSRAHLLVCVTVPMQSDPVVGGGRDSRRGVVGFGDSQRRIVSFVPNLCVGKFHFD